VRIEAASINPSDIKYLYGEYNDAQRPPLPCQAGFEGSGVVVQAGSGVLPYMIDGKRVAVVSRAGGMTWAQYAIVQAQSCLPIPDNVSFQQAAATFVNPFSAMAFTEIARNRGLKCILHSAAASALGKMLVRLCSRFNIKLIGIVRKQEQKDQLQAIQPDPNKLQVLLSTSPTFEKDLTEICTRWDCHIAFDAVSGPLTGIMLSAMPPSSEVQVYGALEQLPCSNISPKELMVSKKVKGFWLTGYLKTKSLLQILEFSQTVVARLLDDVSTEIQGTYSLDNVLEGIDSYLKNMGGGKVILLPQT